MLDFFSDEARRNPYPLYSQVRGVTPVVRVPPPFDAWLILDYEGAKRAITEHGLFSSCVPAPPNWFIFFDPPNHTKQRALIAKAFIPRMIAGLEPYIRQLSGQLLDQAIQRGQLDLATEYAVPLAMKVIARLVGIPGTDWERFRRWSDAILKLSYARGGGPEAQAASAEFHAVTPEMKLYVDQMIQRRRASPTDDLLTRLVEAEVDGQRLTQEEVLGFFQLLVVGGQETTANLINNAILSFVENPDQLARLRDRMELLPSAIEEVLRYRSPLQWIMRTPRRDVEMHGQVIPAGKLVLVMVGSANHDPRQFADPERFDITRDPNPHIAFGHGIHFCLGAALTRLEARIALTDLLTRMPHFELASNDPWEPRKGLHVHGPSRLPIRFSG